MSSVKKIGKNWTAAPNEIINSPLLSFGAKALWIYVWSKPDNWEFSVNGVLAQTNDTKHRVSKFIRELEDKKLLLRNQNKNEQGKFGKAEWIITSKTVDRNTDDGISDDGFTDDGYSHTSNTIRSNTINSNTINKNIDAVLEFFKSVTGRQINIETKSHRNKVKARLSDYSTQDLKDVITLKNSEWKNTDMCKYITPSTIFKREKFDTYMITVRDRREKKMPIEMETKRASSKIKLQNFDNDYK